MDQRFLFDTSILIALVRGERLERLLEMQYQLLTGGVQHALSTISLGEVLKLSSRWKWSPRRSAILDGILSDLLILPPDAAIAREYAALAMYSESIGRRLGQNDCWIAATARAENLILMTTDRDFDILYPTKLNRIWIDHTKAL